VALPVFSPPLQDINVTATSGDGAVVTYSPTATAWGVDTPVSCTPASGSLFPAGNTTVTCAAGATTGTFQVLGRWVLNRRGVSALGLQPSESAC
jgi:phage baseplate assembly protein gpV